MSARILGHSLIALRTGCATLENKEVQDAALERLARVERMANGEWRIANSEWGSAFDEVLPLFATCHSLLATRYSLLPSNRVAISASGGRGRSSGGCAGEPICTKPAIFSLSLRPSASSTARS